MAIALLIGALMGAGSQYCTWISPACAAGYTFGVLYTFGLWHLRHRLEKRRDAISYLYLDECARELRLEKEALDAVLKAAFRLHHDPQVQAAVDALQKAIAAASPNFPTSQHEPPQT